MKIYINGRFLTQRITGVQRYAREIVMAVDEIVTNGSLGEHKWCMLLPKNAVCDLPLKKIKTKECGRLHGYLWEQIELPYYTSDGFLINLCNCAPLVKKNQLLVIHDASIMAYPKAYSWKFRFWYRLMHNICGERVKKIGTVSNFSKEELHKYYNIEKDKIFITYNGVNHMNRITADDSIVDDLDLNDEKFVLAVSSKNYTKNFALVLQVAKLLPEVKFIIVGGANTTVFADKYTEKISNVTYTGYITDEHLVSLYRHAAVFVYPSLYEGFGIPPLEALSQGCPIIVSNCASLPEICGSCADYCDVNSVNSLRNKIKSVINRENRQKTNVKDCLEKYSWKNSANELIKSLFEF